jgi:hypothetical protein
MGITRNQSDLYAIAAPRAARPIRPAMYPLMAANNVCTARGLRSMEPLRTVLGAGVEDEGVHGRVL